MTANRGAMPAPAFSSGSAQNAIDRAIADRIAMLRLLMIIGIVILHVPPYVPLEATGSTPFDFLKAFFSNAVFRSSVPLLTCISAYLLFSAGIDKKFGLLLNKKTKSILIPMIFWNLPIIIILIILNKIGIDINFINEKFENIYDFSILDKTFGLINYPVNYPLNFLRDLFILSLLSPIFGLLIRYNYLIALIVISLFFWHDLDGFLVLRNTMAINFLIGAVIAHGNYNTRILDKFYIPLFSLFILYSVAIIIFEIENIKIFRIISPFLIWPAAGYFLSTGIGAWLRRHSRMSFFIFLAHGPILAILWGIYLGLGEPLPYPVFWVLSPAVVVAICFPARKYLLRWAPGFGRMILGGRAD